MMESAVIERLLLFGLTRQEAVVYVCLVENKELTGYEAAKLTGISRSNVYNALAGLSEKGASYLLEGNVSKYIAVPIAEFCNNKIRRLEEEREFLKENMPKAQETFEGYLTIQGYQNILDKVFYMIRTAQYRLYLSADADFIELLREPLEEAIQRGNKVVLITEKEFPNLRAVSYLSKKEKGEIRLITDSAFVLTGELTGKLNDTCLFSGQKNFVAVFKEALRNKIKLIELEEKDNAN